MVPLDDVSNTKEVKYMFEVPETLLDHAENNLYTLKHVITDIVDKTMEMYLIVNYSTIEMENILTGYLLLQITSNYKCAQYGIQSGRYNRQYNELDGMRLKLCLDKSVVLLCQLKGFMLLLLLQCKCFINFPMHFVNYKLRQFFTYL